MISNNKISHDNLKRNELPQRELKCNKSSHNELPHYELAHNGNDKTTHNHIRLKESIKSNQVPILNKDPLNNRYEESSYSSSTYANIYSTKRRMSILDKSKLNKNPRYCSIFASKSSEGNRLSSNSLESSSINSFLHSNLVRLIVLGGTIIIWVLLLIDTNVANAIDLHRSELNSLKGNNHNQYSLHSNASSVDACSSKRQEANDLEHKVADKVFNIVTSSVPTTNDLNSSSASNTSILINSSNTKVDTSFGGDRKFAPNTEQDVDQNIVQDFEIKIKQGFEENDDIDNQVIDKQRTKKQSTDDFDKQGIDNLGNNNLSPENAYNVPPKFSNELAPIDLSSDIDSESSFIFSSDNKATTSSKNENTPIYNMYHQKGSSFHEVSRSLAIKSASNVFTYEIAIDDLNRISFPFKSINVNTASDAEIQNENGVLYILPMSEDNISLFITPSTCQDLGILLILKPVKTLAKNIVIAPKSSWFICEARSTTNRGTSTNAQKEEDILTFFEKLWLAHDYKEFVLTNKDVFIIGKEDLEAYESINICSESFGEYIHDAFIWRNYMIFILSIENNIGVDLPITCNKGQKAISYANDSTLEAHSKELIFVAYELSKE